MPSEPRISSESGLERRGQPASPGVPAFAELQCEPFGGRIRSNLAAFLAASPGGVTPWQCAPMFRSAYLRKAFPTRPLLESALLHGIVLTALLSVPPSPAPRRTPSEVEVARSERRIIFYNPIDPLPPISPLEPEKPPRREPARRPVSGRLAFHPVERIVSRPPQPD
ncbi:MAG: hypothetical protein ACRD88_22505, partial [Terriglobia bacterium]